jgi:acetylornithine/succinyldiaminopimelate/putrescine aminotransferase
VIVEPVQGEGGVIAANPEFMKAIRARCDQHSALMIGDEVQSGVGRTGRLYAYEWFDIKPDIMTTAKGIGGGFPIAATLSTAAVAESLKVGTHGSTWGGNPMGCAVASVVLDIVNDPAFLDGVTTRREMFEEGLIAIGEKYDVFQEVRGKGLLIGCLLTEHWQGKAREFLQAAQNEGVFILVAGASVLRFAPSLVIPDDDIRQGLERLERAVASLCASQESGEIKKVAAAT